MNLLRIFAAAALCLPLGAAHAAIPIQHWTHASGARVYLVESPAIPMLDVQVNVDGGSRRDPASQAGLASVTAGLLTSGVAAQGDAPALDENQLAEAWADVWDAPRPGSDAFATLFAAATLTESVSRAQTWRDALVSATDAERADLGDAPRLHLLRLLEP